MTVEAGRATDIAPRRLRLGTVGGGQGAFIGAVHHIAARLDDQHELVAGALSAVPDRARASAAAHATRVPAGHPEGYLEGFAQIYADAAALIRAHDAGVPADPAAALLPGIEAGLRGMRFIEAAVQSSRKDAAWMRLPR